MVPPKKNSHWTFALGLLLFLSGAMSAGYAQKASPPVEVPFEFVGDQIIVQVKINGKGPYSMLLDTDTDPTAIDQATARELALGLDAKRFPAGGEGKETNLVQLTRLGTVELGGVTAKDVSAGAIDLTRLAAKLERPIHGVLGYSFLRDRIVQIDYQSSKIRFYAVSPYLGIQNSPNTVNKIAMAFRYEDGVIIDAVFINGQKLKATLDTGSSGTFGLTSEAVALLELEETSAGAEVQKSVGYNGEYESKSAVLKSVRIGRLSVESAPAALWGEGHDKKNYQVNIGNGFFKDYLMTFDFRGKMVVFEKPED